MKQHRAFLAAIGLVLAYPAVGEEPGPAPAASASRLHVPSGTLIELVTRDAVSTKKNDKGDLLYLKVAVPVIVDGATAIPADTIVVAQLTRAEKRGAFGRSGKLDVQLPSGEGSPKGMEGAVIVTVDKDGKIFWRSEEHTV